MMKAMFWGKLTLSWSRTTFEWRMADDVEKANFSFGKLELILLNKEIAVNDLCRVLGRISIFDQKDNGVAGGAQSSDVIVTTKLCRNFNDDTSFCRFTNHLRNDHRNASERGGYRGQLRIMEGLKLKMEGQNGFMMGICRL
jgi:hypothetical protein